MAHMGGTADAEIEAPIEQVWALVEDVLLAPEWQGGLVSVTALERDRERRPTLVESVSDIPVLGRNTQGVRIMRLEEGEKLVGIERIAGDDSQGGEGAG